MTEPQFSRKRTPLERAGVMRKFAKNPNATPEQRQRANKIANQSENIDRMMMRRAEEKPAG